MRRKLTKEKLEQFMKRLGETAQTPGSCFITGGASAIMHGWRDVTLDIDLKFDPEPQGVFGAIPQLKNDLHINVELASPDQFIPEVAGWRERSKHIGSYGKVAFFHYDYVAQALSKIERGHAQDIIDVKAMFKDKLITKEEVLKGWESIKTKLLRYPAINPEEFEKKVMEFLDDIKK